jgi:hypothetical protein
MLDLFHDQDAWRAACHQQRDQRSRVGRSGQLDSLNMHPSTRLRIDHYLQGRSTPYIG